MSERPLIGEFRSKPHNTARGSMMPPVDVEKTAPEPTPANEPVTLAEAATPPDEKLTPAEKYRKRLAEAEISLEEAHAIYDSVLEKGHYEEYIRVGKSRAVFRTRQYEDQLRLQTVLEMQQPKTFSAQEEIVSRYNLAASLFEWKGKPLPHETEEDFEAVLKVIRRLPQPVAALLYEQLFRFDRKAMLVFSEGCTDSF